MPAVVDRCLDGHEHVGTEAVRSWPDTTAAASTSTRTDIAADRPA
jgi:hypothetical protein